MKLKNTDYEQLVRSIRKRDCRIVVYGAGSIGQLVVPYILETYQLYDYMDCYVDRDPKKAGTKILADVYEYEIKNPDILENAAENTVIWITNSNFSPIVAYLDEIKALAEAECYIIPMMQIAANRLRIPKKIHYCWFGGNRMPAFLADCIESWKRHCPDYEIIRWDESNYDVHKYPYTKQAFEKKCYGFVSDVARLDILYEHGGIYFDTDVKLLKPPDGLLYQDGFIGAEKWGYVNTGGGVGAVRHHPMIREMLDYRLKFSFIGEDGSINNDLNGIYETTPFLRHGLRVDNSLQIVNGMTVYPASVFHPYDYMTCETKIEDDTVGIHYFYGGWMNEENRANRANAQGEYVNTLKRIEKA